MISSKKKFFIEKSKQYKAAIIDVFNTHIKYYKQSRTKVQSKIVIDQVRKSYLLLLIG